LIIFYINTSYIFDGMGQDSGPIPSCEDLVPSQFLAWDGVGREIPVPAVSLRAKGKRL